MLRDLPGSPYRSHRFPPGTAGKQQMRIDLVCRDTQRIETVADERQIIQPLRGFSVRPDSLGETRPEEVIRHAPVGCRKKRKRVHQRSAAWDARIASGNRDGFVELPANMLATMLATMIEAAPGGRPDGEAVSRPLVENVTAQDEHRTVHRDVVARMNLAGNAQMIGVQVSSLSWVLRYRSWVLILNFSRNGTCASVGVSQMTIPSL